MVLLRVRELHALSRSSPAGRREFSASCIQRVSATGLHPVSRRVSLLLWFRTCHERFTCHRSLFSRRAALAPGEGVVVPSECPLRQPSCGRATGRVDSDPSPRRRLQKRAWQTARPSVWGGEPSRAPDGPLDQPAFSMIVAISGRVKARSVVVRRFPSAPSHRRAAVAVFSSAASMKKQTS